MLIKLIAAFIIGLASHALNAPTRKLGPRVGSLSRYAIGILLFIPLFSIIGHALGKPKDDTFWPQFEHDITAGLLTAGAQGSGTFLGYVLDSHKDTDG